MGEEHNVVFGQGLKVNRATSTLSSPSLCLMRHIEGEVSVLLALLTLGPCPKTTLCSSPIHHHSQRTIGCVSQIKLLGIVMSRSNCRKIWLVFQAPKSTGIPAIPFLSAPLCSMTLKICSMTRSIYGRKTLCELELVVI